MNGMLVNNAFEFCKLFVSLVCSRNKISLLVFYFDYEWWFLSYFDVENFVNVFFLWFHCRRKFCMC